MKDPVLNSANRNAELLSDFMILITAAMHLERYQKLVTQIIYILPDLIEFQILMRSIERVLVLGALE